MAIGEAQLDNVALRARAVDWLKCNAAPWFRRDHSIGPGPLLMTPETRFGANKGSAEAALCCRLCGGLWYRAAFGPGFGNWQCVGAAARLESV